MTSISEQINLAAWEHEARGPGGNWISALQARHPDVQMELHSSGPGRAQLSLIRTAEGRRGAGLADAAMRDMTKTADEHGIMLHLTPEPLAGDRTTKKTQLVSWYKRHGFVTNSGRNKDYEIRDTMFRPSTTIQTSNITAQAVDLAAWMHEARGADGEWITAFGDPTTAQHVLTYVPGVGTNDSIAKEVENTARTKNRLDAEHAGSTAVIFWRGYRPPPTIEAALHKEDAIEAAGKLANFQQTLRRENPHAHFTVLGHSYGSLVAGEAASRHRMRPDDLVLLASPGTSARHAAEMGLPAGHVWAGANHQDPIARVSGLLSPDFGGNPLSPRYGARVFGAEIPGAIFPGITHKEAHTAYWEPDSQALSNIAHIATGQYSRTTVQAIAASNITSQALNLAGGWRDAWRHELRGPHGEWVHGISEQVTTHAPAGHTPGGTGSLQSRMEHFAAHGAKVLPGLLGGGQEDLNGKVTIEPEIDGSPYVLAKLDWDRQMTIRQDVATHIQATLDMTGEPVSDPGAFSVPLHELIHGVVPEGYSFAKGKYAYQDPANAAIEEGGTELGTIHHAPEWFDKVGVGDRRTFILADEKADKEAQAALMSSLHTEWRSLLQDPKTRVAGMPEVLDSAIMAAENGDYETVQQAIQRVQHLGEPDRYAEAKVLQRNLDTLMSGQHATMSEYARRLQDPARIAAGDAWGHYGPQTAAMQDWVQEVAKAEGFGDLRPGTPGWQRVVELTDEINRNGVDGKLGMMAQQIMRTFDQKITGALAAEEQDSIQENIRDAFSQLGSPDGKAAFRGALHYHQAALREMGLVA